MEKLLNLKVGENIINKCLNTTEVYIIDLLERKFVHIPDNSLFLCGHSHDEVMNLSCDDFYKEIVAPKDLTRITKILDLIYERIKDTQNAEIEYFCYTLRIVNYPQIGEIPEYMMIYHKLEPVDERYCIGTLSYSVLKTSGNLCIYYKDEQYFEKYYEKTGRWKKEIEYLTNRRILIIKYSAQGLTNEDVADRLGIKPESLRQAKNQICKILHLETMQQVVSYAKNHSLMIEHRSKIPTPVKKNHFKKSGKHRKITTEDFLNIRERLDKGQHINSIAKELGIPESTIRSCLKSKKFGGNPPS
jgi:DNA-binding NarL/FixJ family response regulator